MRSIALIALVLAGCSGEETGAQTTVQVNPATAETQAPNARGQQPALPGQTRAPLERKGVAFQVVTVAEGLSHPWGLAFLPDGRTLVTERPGRMRIVSAKGELSEPIEGLPKIERGGEGGLMDVALGPDGLVYWSYSTRGATAVARGLLAGAELTDVQTIWQTTPETFGSTHHGSRLLFAPDGKLFVTAGDRSERAMARRLDATVGKIVRLEPDGKPAASNPFAGRADARPDIWASGFRNVQGVALHPSKGELWAIEHGPRGGDELNVVLTGKDYGWPDVSYGVEYSGRPIGAGRTKAEGVEQPVYYWDPVISPSGMAFYDADLFPAWKGSLFIGGLNPGFLTRLTLDGYRVKGEERLLEDLGERIRDVRIGPEGALYLLTDSPRGRILKLVPR